METSQHNPILLLGKSVKFPLQYFVPRLPFSDSFLTVLKAFAYLYLSVSGREISQHNPILLLGESVKFPPHYFVPRLPFSNYFLTVLKAFAY